MPLICYNLRLVLVKPTLPLFGSLILILSATGTFNYKLAKWLDEKLKPLFVNEHTVSDIFVFADELREMKIKDREVLVSHDVSSLFTNVPVDETIETIPERAFENDWFNRERDLNITGS